MDIENRFALWILTPNGSRLGDIIFQNLPNVDVFVSQNIPATGAESRRFQSLAATLGQNFQRYAGHIFIMSTGIVVRVIAPLIRHKTEDPAVVVVDDAGRHAISLLAGHLGGANELTRRVAAVIGADPVITTATDVNCVPAIDVLARRQNLIIENPKAIKSVNMALLKGQTVHVHDPYNFLKDSLPKFKTLPYGQFTQNGKENGQAIDEIIAGVFIDDVRWRWNLPPQVLVLRPASLVAGIGCNRNTAAGEIKALLEEVLAAGNLAPSSLKCIASINLKADEAGLLALADMLNLPLVFFESEQLNQVEAIENPSTLVEKHVGVKIVCEAEAILAPQIGTLIVPKHTTRNATAAIARIGFSSSASVRGNATI
ncbi:MAG: cobalt-precorrin 5A hydrolase [Desulfobacterales bacterium]